MGQYIKKKKKSLKFRHGVERLEPSTHTHNKYVPAFERVYNNNNRRLERTSKLQDEYEIKKQHIMCITMLYNMTSG